MCHPVSAGPNAVTPSGADLVSLLHGSTPIELPLPPLPSGLQPGQPLAGQSWLERRAYGCFKLIRGKEGTAPLDEAVRSSAVLVDDSLPSAPRSLDAPWEATTNNCFDEAAGMSSLFPSCQMTTCFSFATGSCYWQPGTGVQFSGMIEGLATIL